jgi:hypothetical protein
VMAGNDSGWGGAFSGIPIVNHLRWYFLRRDSPFSASFHCQVEGANGAYCQLIANNIV